MSPKGNIQHSRHQFLCGALRVVASWWCAVHTCFTSTQWIRRRYLCLVRVPMHGSTIRQDPSLINQVNSYYNMSSIRILLSLIVSLPYACSSLPRSAPIIKATLLCLVLSVGPWYYRTQGTGLEHFEFKHLLTLVERTFD